MRHIHNNAIEWDQESPEQREDYIIGHIVDITPEGVALVAFPGAPQEEPIRARSAISTPRRGALSRFIGAKILLTFENRDPSLPVIIGFVHDTLFPPEKNNDVNTETREVVIEGQSLKLDADQELTLSCGESSIILKKDKVIIKSEEITNRALRTNKIKGGAVRIN